MFLAWSYSAGDQPQSLASFSKSVICAKMLTVVRNTDSVGLGQEQKWTDAWLQGISRSSRSTLTHTCHNTHTHTRSATHQCLLRPHLSSQQHACVNSMAWTAPSHFSKSNSWLRTGSTYFKLFLETVFLFVCFLLFYVAFLTSGNQTPKQYFKML